MKLVSIYILKNHLLGGSPIFRETVSFSWNQQRTLFLKKKKCGFINYYFLLNNVSKIPAWLQFFIRNTVNFWQKAKPPNYSFGHRSVSCLKQFWQKISDLHCPGSLKCPAEMYPGQELGLGAGFEWGRGGLVVPRCQGAPPLLHTPARNQPPPKMFQGSFQSAVGFAAF